MPTNSDCQPLKHRKSIHIIQRSEISTMSNMIFLVGNKFHEFGQHESVKTVGELGEMVRTHSFDGLPPGSRIIAGQGVREAQIQALHDQGLWSLAAHGVDIATTLQSKPRASRLQTHKHRLHNAIISHPECLGDDHFQAALLLDERSELMNDHQTGQHIQGMILIEAARQMFLAVTEEYFIGEQASEPYYFVINQMSVNFTGFVFPVEAILDYQINSKDVSNPSRLRFDVTTSIVQGGISATEISFQFTAYYAANIKKKENQQAEKLLQTLCIAASRVNENADTAHP